MPRVIQATGTCVACNAPMSVRPQRYLRTHAQRTQHASAFLTFCIRDFGDSWQGQHGPLCTRCQKHTKYIDLSHSSSSHYCTHAFGRLTLTQRWCTFFLKSSLQSVQPQHQWCIKSLLPWAQTIHTPVELGRGYKCPWQFFPPAEVVYKILSPSFRNEGREPCRSMSGTQLHDFLCSSIRLHPGRLQPYLLQQADGASLEGSCK